MVDSIVVFFVLTIDVVASHDIYAETESHIRRNYCTLESKCQIKDGIIPMLTILKGYHQDIIERLL